MEELPQRFAMASSGQINMSSQDEMKEDGQENVLRRVASIPLVSSAYSMAANVYNSTKDNHPYVKSLCNAAEKGVTSLTEVAVNTAQPILIKLEPQIATASEYVSKGLDTLEEKLPILQLTADQVASDTKEMASSRMASAKEAITSRLSGVVDITKEAVQSSMGDTRPYSWLLLSAALPTGSLPCFLAGAVKGCAYFEEALFAYLRSNNYYSCSVFSSELAATAKKGDLVPVQHSKQEAYLVRLGALSVELRQRAYQHSVAKMKQARQQIQDSLLHLEETIRLIEYMTNEAGQTLAKGQGKLYQMVLEWSKMHCKAKDGKVEACLCVQVEVQTMNKFQNMIRQLQATCQTLISSMQGFPSSLQEKIQQVHQSTRELHASFMAAGSFWEIPSALLAHSYRTLEKAQEYMEELQEYVAHNTPLSWLVGPFKPSSKLLTKTLEPTE